jgi:hypothetical protein
MVPGLFIFLGFKRVKNGSIPYWTMEVERSAFIEIPKKGCASFRDGIKKTFYVALYDHVRP